MSDADKPSSACSAYKYTKVQLGDNKRKELVRQNSDHLLSYYESSIPNEATHYPRSPSPNKQVSAYHHTKTHSGDSSSSAYSNNEADQNDTKETGSETSASVTKRLGTPSKGGADRRRLAIVQLDSSSNGTPLQPSSDMLTAIGSIRQRRGYKNSLAGLALIAPPDAATHTYTHLTPPSTAPLTGDMISRGLKTFVQDKAHQRSASDIAPTVSSRPTMDATKIARAWRFPSKRVNDNKGSETRASTLPSSQSTAPKTADQGHSYLTLDLADLGSSIGTPLIGEAKDIHVPVAAPIVMNLENVGQPKTLPTSRADSPASSTVCGHGQSAKMISHTTNDDKTSDPVSTPRLQSPRINIDSEVGQGHQTRSSRVTALRSAKMNEVKAIGDIGDSFVGQTKGFIHRREPATVANDPDNLTFSMNSNLSQKPSPNRESNDLTLDEIAPSRPDGPVSPASRQYRVMPPTPVSKPPTSELTRKAKDGSPPKIDHTKFDQWLKENPQFSTRDSRRGASLDEHRRYGLDRPTSRLSVDHFTVEPPEPPLKGLRRSLTSKVKRFSSLSRTGSLSSKSASRSSQDTRNSSRTPSPLANYQTRAPFLNPHKVRSINPAALFCHEISGQTTSLQRCFIYANKINELSMHDCGLTDWIVQMKDQSLTPQRQRGPSPGSLVPQPRHTSRSSIISEVTFPRRLDATTATDLSPGQFDDVSSPCLPQLPYPSLALRTIPPRSNTSTSSITPPTSLRSLTPSFSTSGFFSALGRKASLSKRDRTVLSTRISSPGVAPGGARLPTGKNVPSVNPRPIQITSPPTIPGGPRAPPSRSKRSQTYMMKLVAQADRDNSLGQPSPLNDTHTVDNVIDIKPDPEFSEQVDKLAALIPQADRNILAGYLRRAGSDMLAIGQYLEDERTGVVRSH